MSINVLAFNCSPNEENGNTAKLLGHLLEGMKNRGANVEVYYTQRLHIDKCLGCTEDPNFVSTGECRIVDDMKYIYPKMKNADLWIFATPNYNDVINHSLVKLLDRLEPLFDDVVDFTNGNKLLNSKKTNGKILLVSTGNHFDKEPFIGLIEQIEAISVLFKREYIGTIMRPHAWALNDHDIIPKKIENLYKSLIKAGEEIIDYGKIQNETLFSINKNLINKKSFLTSLFSAIE